MADAATAADQQAPADTAADTAAPADAAAGPDADAADTAVQADDSAVEIAADSGPDAPPGIPCKVNEDCPLPAEPCAEARCELKVGLCKTVQAKDNSPCDDGEACTLGDTCKAGSCQPGKNGCGCKGDGDCAGFDDGNPCNGKWFCDGGASPSVCAPKPGSAVKCPPGDSACTVNACNAVSGACEVTAANDGGACEDGKVCTSGDVCLGGQCLPGKDECPCKKNSDCTDDGDLCNGVPYCDKSELPWLCKTNPGTVVSCSAAGDTACLANSCDGKSGKCAMKPVNSGGACNDGDPCTGGDSCSQGQCQAGVNLCGCQSDGDCAKLDDGNLCNGALYCNKTVEPHICQVNPATVVVCPSADDTACATNQCSPSSGKCGVVMAKDGTACNDDNPCTVDDACAGGKCAAKTNTCPCSQTSDCASKDDGNLCNGSLFCDKGQLPYVCTVNPATVVVCPSAQDSQCSKNLCTPATGKCAPANVNQGVPCDADGNPCTQGDVCEAGTCEPGLNNCPCQVDKDCLPLEDGNPCNGLLYCDKAAKKCLVNPNTVVVCNAAQDSTCAVNQCDPGNGLCKMTPRHQGQACDADGNGCTVGDSCEAGKCIAGPNTCACQSDSACAPYEDGNLCNGKLFCDKTSLPFQCKVNPATVVNCGTGVPPKCQVNTCLPATGKCTYTAVTDNSACEDGQLCTFGDVCKAGQCLPGTDLCGCKTDLDCAGKEDGNVCNGTLYCDKTKLPFQCKINAGTIITCPTVDDEACLKRVCQPLTGQCPLQAVAQGEKCDDGNACTSADQCKLGNCAGSAVDCADADACSQDDCDYVDGCLHLPNPAAACDDGNACTVDSCDGKSGCSHSNLASGACDDGNPCSKADTCNGGKCVGGPGGCDDGNVCTADSCGSDGKSCLYSPLEVACGDGRMCVGGRCGGCEAWRRSLRWGCEMVVPGSLPSLKLAAECDRTAHANREEAEDAATLSDGRVLSVGAASTDGTQKTQGWAVWLGATGLVLQQKTYGLQGSDRLLGVSARAGGAAWVVGSGSAAAGTQRPWLLGLAADGKVQIEAKLPAQAQESPTDTGSFDDVVTLADGGALAVGQLTNVKAGASDALVARYDGQGKLLWAKALGSESSGQAAQPDRLWSAALAADGSGVLAAGHRGNAKAPLQQQDGWLIKVDLSGNVVWSKTFGGASWDAFYGVAVGKDGTVAAVGTVGKVGIATAGAGWLVLTAANGEFIRQVKVEGFDDDVLRMVGPHPAGGWVAAGYQVADHSADATWNSGYDRGLAWAVRWDAADNLVWKRTYDDMGVERILGGEVRADGDALLAGDTRGLSTKASDLDYTAKPDGFVLRIDAATGQETCPCQYFAHFDTPSPPAALYSVVTATADTFFAVGDSNGAGNLPDGWVHAFDGRGKVLFEKVIAKPGTDRLRGIARGPDGTLLAVGSTDSGGAGSTDGWVVLMDSNGKTLVDKTFGGSGADELLAVTALPDGGWAAAGRTANGAVGEHDGWLVVLDKNANKVAQLVHGYTWEDSLLGVAVVGAGKDARILAVGRAEVAVNGSLNVLVVLTNLQGEPIIDPADGKPLLYHFDHGDPITMKNNAAQGWDYLNGLVRTPDGGAAGSGLSITGIYPGVSKVRFDAKGMRATNGGHGVLWYWGYVTDLAVLRDGTTVQVGAQGANPITTGSMFAIALDPAGNRRWVRGDYGDKGFGNLDKGGESQLHGATVTANDQVVLVGWVRDLTGTQRGVVQRVDAVRGESLLQPSINNGNIQCSTAVCDLHYGALSLARSQSCDDDNACTTNDYCSQGQCSQSTKVTCDDGNACTVDTCVSAGGCSLAPLAQTTPPTLCTKTLACNAGNCGPCGFGETAWPTGGPLPTRGVLGGEPDNAGGAWVYGHTTATWSLGAPRDSFVARTDGKGAPLWVKDISYPDDNQLHGVLPLANGNLIAMGYRLQPGTDGKLQYDEWTVTLSTAGTLLSDEAPVVPLYQRVLAMRPLANGFVTTGETASKGNVKVYDAAGKLLGAWQNFTITATLGQDVTQTADGGYAVAMHDLSYTYDRLVVAGVSKDFKTKWYYDTARTAATQVDRIFALPDDSVVVTLSEAAGGERIRLVRISKTGVLMGDWYDPDGLHHREMGSLLRGNELLLLTRRSNTPQGTLPSLSRADLQGNTLWSITLPTTLPTGKATDVQPNTLIDLPGPTMLIFSNLLQGNNISVRYVAARVLGDDGTTFCGPPVP